MASPERWDVAVVGASPAGIAAAHAAAIRGLDVVLLEADAIGEPEPPAVVGFAHVWPEAWSPPPDSVRSRFDRVALTLPGETTVAIQAPGRIVDRVRMDRWALERVRRAAAHVRTRTGPWEVRGPGRLRGEAGEVEAEVVVFADGARSIASAIVDPVEAPEHLVWGVTHEVPVDARGGPLAIRVGDHAPGGRTQLVPIDASRTWHWTFVARERSRAIDRAEQALQATAERRGWAPTVVDEARRLHVAPDPVRQRPARLAGPRTLVAGGAGGMGGLEVGLASGRRAGEAAARAVLAEGSPEPALRAYADACHRRFGPAYRGLDRLFAFAEATPDPVIEAIARPQVGRELALDELAGLLEPGASRWSRLATLTLEGLVSQARSRLARLN